MSNFKMEKNILLMRHLEDDPHSSANRDPHILKNEVVRVEGIVERIIVDLSHAHLKNVVFISSTLIRAGETSALVRDALVKKGITCLINSDIGLNSMEHGQMNPSIREREARRLTEKEAKKIYMIETFEQNNPFYRYGDPIHDRLGYAKYPSLSGKYTKYGECQVEMSYRMYKFLTSLVERSNELEDSLIILTTHTVFILRSLSFAHIYDSSNPMWYVIPSGDIYKQEQNLLGRVLGKDDYATFFAHEIPIYYLKMKALLNVYDLLTNELEVIKASYLQKYGISLP